MIIHRNGKKAPQNVPECWSELTGPQLMQVADVLFAELEPDMRDILILQALSGIKDDILQMLSHEVIAVELLPLFWWVTESCDLTAQRLPYVELPDIRLYGPADKLGNLRFTEFDHSERALHAWHKQTDNLELLYYFVATLYRPAKADYEVASDPEGDVREEFNPNLTTKYAQLLAAHAPAGFAYAVLLWYKGCREYIAGSFPSVFGNAPVTEEETISEPSYYALIRAIAKTGIYGSFTDVEQLYLYNALMELEAAEDERVRLEEAMEAAKSNNNGA